MMMRRGVKGAGSPPCIQMKKNATGGNVLTP